MRKEITKTLAITRDEYSDLDHVQKLQLVNTIGYMDFDDHGVCMRDVHPDNKEVRQCLMTLVKWLLEDLYNPLMNAESKVMSFNLAHKIIEVFEK